MLMKSSRAHDFETQTAVVSGSSYNCSFTCSGGRGGSPCSQRNLPAIAVALLRLPSATRPVLHQHVQSQPLTQRRKLFSFFI
ncbi:hypothetical protein IF1G_02360 [Cordyceps javanica]|uniref:Uncharacterized protein n=1 Tax=Cordyceps javanica TaxID=43265 RepID=A0A545V985_9HYPO|nr:hypothetical protein IF1G_02360 [Cordyceps javanica]